MARVLITGASRGLGRSKAIVLSQRGHEVIASAQHITDLVEQCEARLAKYNAQERGSPPEQVARAIADLIEQSTPPRRMLVGAQAEKLLARLGGRLTSRLTRLGLNW